MLQARVHDRLRGRSSPPWTCWQSGRLASLGAGGLLADTLGIQAVYYLGGVLLLAAGAVGLTARLRAQP